MNRARLFSACLLGLALAGLVSCSGDSTSRVIAVPADQPTIQNAVDAARAGDVVLISPGTYNEAVKVTTQDIVIRGVDRNTVVLDGQDRLTNGIFVGANNVTVQNLTVHNYTQNGVVFNGIDAVSKGDGVDSAIAYGTQGHSLVGYRVSYVTSYNNGLYGIYAFSSTKGIVEHSYVSGHPDSGLYIGQCKPCDVVINDVTAERNAIGYYGTNSSGNVYLINSTFKRNRLGIAPNSQKAEELAPQEETFIVGNLVVDNDDPSAPAVPSGFFAGGIAVGGGTKNLVLRNRVVGHSFAGIVLTTMNNYLPRNNRIEGNVLSGNATDLAYIPEGATTSDGNCFVNNTFLRSVPLNIEKVMPCAGSSSLTTITELKSPIAPPQVDYRKVRAPVSQPTMPQSVFSKPITHIAFTAPDLSKIAVPAP